MTAPASGFEDRQRLAGVTAGHADDLVDRRIVDFDFAVQSALVFHRACDGVARSDSSNDSSLTTTERRQQWFDDGEARILGGRADEGDVTVLDGGQQHVLLRFGETMHLVDEQDCLRAVADESAPRAGEHVARVLHPDVTADSSSNARPD